MVAACNGHTAVASLLLDRGADINAANLVSYSFSSPLVRVMYCCGKEEMKTFFSSFLSLPFLSLSVEHRPFEITSESFYGVFSSPSMWFTFDITHSEQRMSLLLSSSLCAAVYPWTLLRNSKPLLDGQCSSIKSLWCHCFANGELYKWVIARWYVFTADASTRAIDVTIVMVLLICESEALVCTVQMTMLIVRMLIFRILIWPLSCINVEGNVCTNEELRRNTTDRPTSSCHRRRSYTHTCSPSRSQSTQCSSTMLDIPESDSRSWDGFDVVNVDSERARSTCSVVRL